MNLEIGVEIFVSGSGNEKIEKIVRETSTMWITENDSTRIYKKDNSIVGNSSNKWSFKRFVVANQNHYDMLKKRSLVCELRSFNYDKLSLEQLEKIEDIIKNKSWYFILQQLYNEAS